MPAKTTIFTIEEYKRFCGAPLTEMGEVIQVFMLMNLFRANGITFNDDIIAFKGKACLPYDRFTVKYQIYQFLYLCDAEHGEFVPPPVLRSNFVADYMYLFRCEFEKQVEDFMALDE